MPIKTSKCFLLRLINELMRPVTNEAQKKGKQRELQKLVRQNKLTDIFEIRLWQGS